MSAACRRLGGRSASDERSCDASARRSCAACASISLTNSVSTIVAYSRSTVVVVRSRSTNLTLTDGEPTPEGGASVDAGARGGGMRRMSGGRARGPKPGQFAVRITHQGRTSTQAFTVHYRRGATSVLGSYPGEEVTDEEEADGGDGR